LEENIRIIVANWLDIYYATDASVVGEKIADSIRKIIISKIFGIN